MVALYHRITDPLDRTGRLLRRIVTVLRTVEVDAAYCRRRTRRLHVRVNGSCLTGTWCWPMLQLGCSTPIGGILWHDAAVRCMLALNKHYLWQKCKNSISNPHNFHASQLNIETRLRQVVVRYNSCSGDQEKLIILILETSERVLWFPIPKAVWP
jgi:hypothetical protein